jgi:hypothetical protein
MPHAIAPGSEPIARAESKADRKQQRLLKAVMAQERDHLELAQPPAERAASMALPPVRVRHILGRIAALSPTDRAYDAAAAMLLCGFGALPASAQNGVSHRLLELDENERSEAFTLMLRDSSGKCDRVIRTLFNRTVLGVDEWEALCRDRKSYSIGVLEKVDDAIVAELSCRELLATSKRLLHRAGSRSKPARCRINEHR